jgi:hypothetical protein
VTNAYRHRRQNVDMWRLAHYKKVMFVGTDFTMLLTLHYLDEVHFLIKAVLCLVWVPF